MVCLSLNMKGLKKNLQKEKNEALYNFLYQSNTKMITLQEINLNWDKLPINEQWHERVRGWWEGG